MKQSSILLLCMLLFTGCKRNLGPDEYKTLLAKNDAWHRSEKIDGYTLRADYIPTEWIAYTNSGNTKNRQVFDKSMEEAGGMHYFRISIDADGSHNMLKKGLGDKEEYFDRLYYLSYRMKDDIKMRVGDKTYPCELYVYERAYDLSSKISTMVGFKKPVETDEDIVIEIYPAVLGTGKVKLRFKKSKIESAPKLVIG